MRSAFTRAQKRSAPSRRARMRRFTPRAALMGFCALCLAVSVFILTGRAMDAKRAREIGEENERIVAATVAGTDDVPAFVVQELPTFGAEAAQATPAPAAALLPDIGRLLEKNGDCIGWLNVDCIDEINFAIVQRDNAYYLSHDFSQSKNGNGTAFLDETCKILPQDDNLTVYAHNMRDGAMFGKLNRMTSLSRIMEAPFTEFATLYERNVYVPIAVLYCSVDPFAADYFVFSANRFATEAAFEQHIARAKALSAVALPFDARYGDKLLTLATCATDSDDKRLVVVLRAMRADETKEQLQATLGS